MENRAHALIAGIFTLLLGMSCVAALWWFGGQREQTDQYLVVTQKNITGLNAQAQVRYRGIRVGKVESIELDPVDVSKTLIRISIGKEIPITRGTTAKLGYQGITGIAHILLEDTGKDATRVAAPAGELARIAMQDSLIQELTDVGGDTLRNARDLMAHANQILSSENRENFSRILSNLEATTGHTREATAQLHELLTPENVRLLRSTLVHAEQTAGQAGPFFAEARGLVSRLQSVSEKLDATLGETSSGGAAALIPKLSELSSELSANSTQLNRVLQMLEDSPQSLIFGHQKSAPGPGEPGFAIPVSSAQGKDKP